MSTGVSCVVLVDGVRAADGCIDAPGDAPTILDALSVTWGRSDTMTQPPPDSCSFSVVDPVGGDAFTSIYRTGRRIDVLALGDTTPAPPVGTFLNPGFETPSVTWAATGGTAVRGPARVYSGSQALRVTPAPGQPVTLWLAPGVFQPAGTNPSAWDDIPQVGNRQTWTGTLSVWVPLGSTATVSGALFSGPYATAGVQLGPVQTVLGDGAWHSLVTEYTLTQDGKWLGFLVVLNPTGATWDQMGPSLTWNAVDPSLTWDEMGLMLIDDVQVMTPGESAAKRVLVFTGRITDISASWDDSLGAPVAEITASGFTADLENRLIGSEPWPVESVTTRSQRILTLAGLPITIDIDSTIAPTLLSWVDVDRQGATGLLQTVATSVDGVLWAAAHQALGAYFRLEDPALRAALLTLQLDGSNVIVIVRTNPDAGYDLTACVILREPLSWVQDVSDVATRASVTWKVQGLDNEGNPTTSDATESVVDPALESQYGTRNVSVSTELQAATDAQAVAQRIMARATPEGWRATGLAIDDEDVTGGPEGAALMLGLLDGTSRIGAPIVIGDLPAWSPAGGTTGVYLEGGAYQYVGGRWVLALTVSVATGLGISASWDEMGPSWQWNQWDPAISWNDLRGVSA